MNFKIQDSKSGLKGHAPGFTLVEILIVIVLMAFLLALSAPFVNALRSDLETEKTLRQVKTDLISSLTYSLAGKSVAPLDSNASTLQLPVVYALHFSVLNSDEAPHYGILELALDQENSEGWLHPIHEQELEYPSPDVFLKTISLLDRKGKKQIPVDEAYIFFFPPFGKVFFLPGSKDFFDDLTLKELEAFPSLYSEINLIFQYKDQISKQKNLNFTTNKVLTIL